MSRITTFKLWLNAKWHEHKDEIYAWERCDPTDTQAEFFRKNRWNLKRLYKHERKQDSNK